LDNIFDADRAITTIQRFITGKLLKSGMNGYVVGLSGGLDSSLAATLAVRAIGKDKVLGVMMPYRTSSPDSLVHATELSEQLGMASRTVDITPMIDA
jgi:NAD+ synthase